jgi:hypothetical protein
MGIDINNSKLVGGKRKNGHKSDCVCHICENMKNKAKRGGYEEDIEKEKEKMMGGSKKKNGHRKDCKCPICKNMKNSKKRGGSKSSRRTRRRRGGEPDVPDEENQIGDIEEAGVKATPGSDLQDSVDDSSSNETPASNDEYDKLDAAERGEAGDNVVGGTRKRRRGNGHKKNCKCPICKNMRKKKGGNSDIPDEENQIGDIEEAGVKSTSGSDLKDSVDNSSVDDSPSNEMSDSDDEYDQLDAAEKGEAGNNVVGGTRKRRRRRGRGNKRVRKTRRLRRTRRRR